MATGAGTHLPSHRMWIQGVCEIGPGVAFRVGKGPIAKQSQSVASLPDHGHVISLLVNYAECSFWLRKHRRDFTARTHHESRFFKIEGKPSRTPGSRGPSCRRKLPSLVIGGMASLTKRNPLGMACGTFQFVPMWWKVMRFPAFFDQRGYVFFSASFP